MGIWMQLQCDGGSEDADPAGYPLCHTRVGSDFGEMARPNGLGVRLALRNLEARATRAGWTNRRLRRGRNVWICPYCVVRERINRQ